MYHEKEKQNNYKILVGKPLEGQPFFGPTTGKRMDVMKIT
jgi:hypothetical protein